MALSAMPEGASATPQPGTTSVAADVGDVIERIDGTEELLYWPRAVASRDGHVYVADRGSHRVIRLDAQMRADAIFGREGAGPGEMQHPYDVAVDSSGNVFVVDISLRRISKYAADGSFIRSVAAPEAATLLIDSQDELIVYPAPGDALLQRYSNDLEAGEKLFVKRHERMHRTRMGVLMAMDGNDRLFLLDQVDLTLTVYNRDMKPVMRWPVGGPGLEESMAAALASKLEKDPGSNPTIPGFQAMALDPSGHRIAFAYLVRQPDFNFTRVAWFTDEGQFLNTEDRSDSVYAATLLADGRLIEGSTESLTVFFNRGPQPDRATRGN
jgi:hypothetical protein